MTIEIFLLEIQCLVSLDWKYEVSWTTTYQT